MSGYNNFVNQSSIDEKKEETRKARKLILDKAKEKYEADERKEKKRKERGEGTWMLDTVSKRIQKEERDIEDAKSKKKKKKKKKKHKKLSDSSASDSEGETWVEAKTIGASNDPGKPLQRDSWMETPLDFLPMTSRQEIRDAANREKETAKAEAEKHLQPGQHARELNPYWKNGGAGVPSAAPSSTETSKPSGATGDGGLSWLLKSLSRIKQQSKDEGRSVEEIAAERYGSLDRLMSMIRDVEKSQGRGGDGGRRDRQNEGNRDYRDRERERNRNRERERNRERDDDRDRNRGRDDDRDRNRERDDDRDRNRGRADDRDRERKSDEKEDRRDREKLESKDTGGRRIGFQRPQSDDQEISDRYRKSSFGNGQKMFKRPGDDNDDEVDIKDRDRKSVTDERRKMFKRPGDDNNDGGDSKDRDRKSVTDERRKMFKRPGDDEEEEHGGYHRTFDKPRHRDGMDDRRRGNEGRDGREDWRKSSRREDERVPGWKKKDIESVKEDKEVERKKERSRKKSSSESSSSSSEDEGQRSHSVNDEMSEEVTERVQAAPKVMSEEELNDLAAKVFRAEIMGDESLVSELKAKLEEARTLREASKAGGGAGDFVHSAMKEREGKRRKEEEDMEEGDDNVVVLSRTNKAGMTRPVLPSASDEWGGRGAGKKRKKKNVTTHNEAGDRTKFFDDDDSFDLKTLVEREKAGTAEDQNAMFARLAGREKDRDMDVDDIFVSKAARKQQEEDSINREKMGAIMEHRKKSKAMDKCTRCFEKVPKHLIIAIGRKSYLCLPDHASMTEGHCLIVPMAHSSSATSLDEDVWQDMQLFRKSLVQMFLSQDKDVVVMETVMNLKYFPHTAIECIPLEKEVGDLAPIYFKKAMQEVGPEWSHNKKIHELSKKDIRHTVPKGFPYFSVDFGLQGGFAHVIEDEATFTSYFGREIVGGMLDVEPTLWRKPRKQNFEDQRQKVLQFEQWWSEFDWTQDLS